MKRLKLLFVVAMVIFGNGLFAQSALDLSDFSIQLDDLEGQQFRSFMEDRLQNSQFVFIGEQHGIKEAGVFTNVVYNLGQPFNYKTLCIETDAIAAAKLKSMAKTNNTLARAKQFDQEFKFSIPFYNNSDDFSLFKNVVGKRGDIWGIDQTLMTQFRYNFDHLIRTSSNRKLIAKLEPLKAKAVAAFKETIDNKDFDAPYIFKYDKATHDELMSLAKSGSEKEVIQQLWLTREIYTYNSEKQFYMNNNVRGQLMKSNFMRYYNAAKSKNETPKVIFKLGAFHAAKGLSMTGIYDIANLGHELATSNGMGSLHMIVMGISGQVAVGNPFTPNPVVPFNNVNQYPEEIQKIVPSIEKKYYVLDLVPMRISKYSNSLSDAFKDFVFAYDVIVLVKDAEALAGF